MFNAKIKTGVFKDMVNVISTLVDEVKFNVGKEGLNVKAVDPAHVAMLELTLGTDAFEEYEAEDMEIGIEVDKLKDVLKLSRPDDTIEFEFMDEENRLVARIGNLTKSMSLLDISGMTDPRVPNLTMQVEVGLSYADLSRGVKASETVSEHIALQAVADSFTISSEGDRDSASLVIPKDDLESFKCETEVRSLFSLEYFSNMIKSISSGQTVTMFIGKEYPVKIVFQIADGKGQVVYLLAPRIEE